MLELIHLKKQLANFELSIDITLSIDRTTAIFGISGSGKTTLINLLSGLSKPDKGIIRLNGHTFNDSEKKCFIPASKRKIGYIFQDARLFPHYNVKRNLTYGMKKNEQQSFNQVVELLNIDKLLTRYPSTLSGGEKQRVAIGRALLSSPELLLMDEPLSSLDLPLKQELLSYLEFLPHETKIPIIYVSHSLNEIRRIAQQVMLIKEGKLQALVSVDEITTNPIFAPWQMTTLNDDLLD